MSAALRPCLWFDGNAEEAAEFYAGIFADSRVERVNRAPVDWPAGNAGDVITVDMVLMGEPVMLLNGGDAFKPTPAVSLMAVTSDQEETDRYWDALIEGGGTPMACGWCQDRYGFAWQITPKALLDMLGGDEATASRAFAAMNQMVKIDIAALEEAVAS